MQQKSYQQNLNRAPLSHWKQFQEIQAIQLAERKKRQENQLAERKRKQAIQLAEHQKEERVKRQFAERKRLEEQRTENKLAPLGLAHITSMSEPGDARSQTELYIAFTANNKLLYLQNFCHTWAFYKKNLASPDVTDEKVTEITTEIIKNFKIEIFIRNWKSYGKRKTCNISNM